MENFLLLWDELDDAATSLRLLWPRFFGFLLASAVFAGTVLLIMTWPLSVAIVALLTAVVLGLRQPSLTPLFRTDP